MTEKLSIHPIADVFPVMEAGELARLADDIQANGLRDPITVYEGKVLDGRNRALACAMRGIEVQTRNFQGSRMEALAFVWSENRMRRHLTSSQAAMAEAKRAKLDTEYASEVEKMKEEAKAKQKVGKGEDGSGGRGKKKYLVEPIPSGKEDRLVNTQLARATGTNRKYAFEADRLLAYAPDLAEKVSAGTVTIPQARTELKRRQKRAELNAKAKAAKRRPNASNPTWTIRHGDCLTILPTVEEKARLVFADPPYNIGIDYGEGKAADRLADTAYLAWVEKWLVACRDLLTDDGSLWVLIGDEYAGEYAVTLKRLGLSIRSWIKWWEAFGVNCVGNFNRCSRHLFYCVRDARHFVFNEDAVTRPSDRQAKYHDKRASPGGKLWDNVWGIQPSIPRLTGTCDERLPDFPTQLPLALLDPIVRCASDPGDLVVDPFNGSGTTGVAAVRSGRRYLGVEKSESFAKLARLRLEGVGHE